MKKAFNNLHARIGHVWDTDKTDGSDIIVAEVDPHGFMGEGSSALATRQKVAQLFAAAPDLLESLEMVEDRLRNGVQLYQHEIQNLRIAISKARGAY